MDYDFLVKQQAFEWFIKPLLNNKLLDKNNPQYEYSECDKCYGKGKLWKAQLYTG